MLTLKLFAVIVFAAALTAVATFGGAWKWHRAGQAAQVRVANGWTWDRAKRGH